VKGNGDRIGFEVLMMMMRARGFRVKSEERVLNVWIFGRRGHLSFVVSWKLEGIWSD